MNANQTHKSNGKMPIERFITWVGSVQSLVVHTAAFIISFLLVVLHVVPFDTMLLVLTTLVSLEAIYLAIFIQMTVNRQARELEEVSEDVEDIQEDIEEISEDVEEITEGEEEDAERRLRQAKTLDQLTEDVQRVLADLDKLKRH